jgi:hypothetical protein
MPALPPQSRVSPISAAPWRSWTPSPYQAYAGVTGLPKSGDVASLLAGTPTVGATFGASGYTTLAQGAMGASFAIAAGVSGPIVHHSEIDLVLDSTQFANAGTLSIGFLNPFDLGGFESLQFVLAYEGITIIDVTFLTVADANAFFTDRISTIGDFAVGPELDISVDLFISGTAVGQGYGLDFVIGADTLLVQGPTDPGGGDPIPVPEPNTLLILAGSLAVLLVRRRSAAP